MKAVEPHGVDGIAVSLFDSEDLRQFFGDANRRIMAWPAPNPVFAGAGSFMRHHVHWQMSSGG